MHAHMSRPTAPDVLEEEGNNPTSSMFEPSGACNSRKDVPQRWSQNCLSCLKAAARLLPQCHSATPQGVCCSAASPSASLVPRRLMSQRASYQSPKRIPSQVHQECPERAHLRNAGPMLGSRAQVGWRPSLSASFCWSAHARQSSRLCVTLPHCMQNWQVAVAFHAGGSSACCISPAGTS